MPELLENKAIAPSDTHQVTVSLLDGSATTVELNRLGEFIDQNRDKIKFTKSRRRRQPLGFPED